MTAILAPATSRTRTLLTCAAVAAPLWAAVSLARSLGWLQIANFVVAGVLTVAGAAGLRRVLPGKWAPRLVAVNGAGMIAAGVFVMDAGAGNQYGPPAALTWHSFGHFAAGTVSFIALIAACYVLGRHFSRAGDRRNAVASRVAGTALLAGDLWASGGGAAGSLTLAVGAITAMLWVSLVATRYLR